ncbi:MAG: glycosyltransferase family 2 protein [Acidobacteriota bacterium]|jgi:GT2 family glycosyltransferase
MEGSLNVHVVILNWNRWELTLDCLRSLAALDPAPGKIWVVDNGSTDGSVRHLRESGLAPNLLENPRNLGHAAGCNRAVLRALEEDAGFVWLLNNDTAVEPGCLGALLRRAREDPAIGAVGSVLRHPGVSGRIQAWGGGRVGRWTGWARHVRGPGRRLDYLTGASVLIRSEALRAVGLLDEGFFFFWDDTDLGFRLRRGGWRLAVAADAVVRHRESATIGPRTADRARLFADGMVRFFRRHARLPLLPATGGLVQQLARAVWHGSGRQWAGTWRGWFEGWRDPAGAP